MSSLRPDLHPLNILLIQNNKDLFGYKQGLLHPGVLNFLSICFQIFFYIWKALLVFMGMHLTKYLIVQFFYVHLKGRNAGWILLMFIPFEIVSICVQLLYFFSKTCLTAAYSHLYGTCKAFHVTGECLEQLFVCFPTLVRLYINYWGEVLY